jgi:DNA-binding MarR family transcriptional regulator
MPDSPERLKALQQLGRTYRAFLAAHEREVGVFMPRWRILLHLYQQDQPCGQRQLADASHMDPGALSRQLAALEELGWISRRADPHDRRLSQVTLAAQGRRQVEQSLPRRAAFIERTLGDIPEQRLRQLVDDLQMLETRFGASARPEAEDAA